MSLFSVRHEGTVAATGVPINHDCTPFGVRLSKAVAHPGAVRAIRKGQRVLEEGQQGQDVYLVTDGLLKCVKTDDLGREVVVHLAETGDLIGLELLVGSPSNATWQAVTHAKVKPLPCREVRNTLAGDAGLALDLSQVVIDRLSLAEDKVRDFAHKSARKRASEVLLRRAAPAGEGSDEVVIRNLTRQDLAAMAGMTPETFIRILSSFRERGIVKTQGRLISILDPERLTQIAGRTRAPQGNGNGRAPWSVPQPPRQGLL